MGRVAAPRDSADFHDSPSVFIPYCPFLYNTTIGGDRRKFDELTTMLPILISPSNPQPSVGQIP